MQAQTFLGDKLDGAYRIQLRQTDTLVLPAGWPHAVYTPEDSLIVGGNFLRACDLRCSLLACGGSERERPACGCGAGLMRICCTQRCTKMPFSQALQQLRHVSLRQPERLAGRRMHLSIWDMESRLGVKARFRFPFFRPLVWHTARCLVSGPPVRQLDWAARW